MNTIDKESKQLVMNYFKINLSVDCYDFDIVDQYHYVDLSCEISGKKIGIEVKNRESYKSTSFGDVLIEQHKVDEGRKLKEYDAIFAFNIFKDNIMAYSNVENGHPKDLYCPSTSYFKNRSYKNKQCWSMPQSHKIRILDDGKFVKIH